MLLSSLSVHTYIHTYVHIYVQIVTFSTYVHTSVMSAAFSMLNILVCTTTRRGCAVIKVHWSCSYGESLPPSSVSARILGGGGGVERCGSIAFRVVPAAHLEFLPQPPSEVPPGQDQPDWQWEREAGSILHHQRGEAVLSPRQGPHCVQVCMSFSLIHPTPISTSILMVVYVHISALYVCSYRCTT